MRDWIASDYPYMVVMVKGVAGGATDQIEYLCEAETSVQALTDAVWRVRKLVYDATGFNTQILWADGDRNFDNAANAPDTLTYVAL